MLLDQMECKRKRLDCDSSDNMAINAETQVRSLFQKEFCYIKSSRWTLETTSLFRNFTKGEELKSSKQLYTCGTVKNKTELQDASGLCTHQTLLSSLNKDLNKCLKGEMKNIPLHDSVTCACYIGKHGDMETEFVVTSQIETARSGCSQGEAAQLHSCHDTLSHSHCCHHLNHYENISKPNQTVNLQEERQRQTRGLYLSKAWSHNELLDLKDNLNSLKDQLSDKEMVVWHQHTSSTNLAGKIVNTVKQQFRAELCTQAWCKFHEILARYEIVPQAVLRSPFSSYCSVHLCEAPGAFITSLNHFLVSRGFRGTWHWVGTTLNPYYEGNSVMQMIDDDRFIRNSYRNWFFGEDNSGDLMSEQNLKALKTKLTSIGDVHLVTADGSINCQENPAEQEKLVSRLHVCEALSACLILAPDGNLVIKLFTMFESSTISLLYFLNCAFQKVIVCKPATSKSGNSEVYVVCCGYTAPMSEDHLLALFSEVCSSTDEDTVLFTQDDIASDFLDQHIDCCKHFSQLQSRTIAHNLELYGHMGQAEMKTLENLQELCVEHYIGLTQLKPIKNDERIIASNQKGRIYRFSSVRALANGVRSVCVRGRNAGNPQQLASWQSSMMVGKMQGTFRQRQEQHTVTWLQLLDQMSEYSLPEYDLLYVKCHEELNDGEVKKWCLVKGRPLKQVFSSQFCDSTVLENWTLLMLQAKVKHHQEIHLLKYAAHVQAHVAALFRDTCHGFCKEREPQQVLYHLALAESATSCMSQAFQVLPISQHVQLLSVDSLQKLEDGAVFLFVDITWPAQLCFEEFLCCRRLLSVVIAICSYLRIGSNVVVLMPVALTRLSAGLLFILARMFKEMCSKMLEESPFAHQLLYFQGFRCAPYTVLQYLESLRQNFQTEHKSTTSEDGLSSFYDLQKNISVKDSGDINLVAKDRIHEKNNQKETDFSFPESLPVTAENTCIKLHTIAKTSQESAAIPEADEVNACEWNKSAGFENHSFVPATAFTDEGNMVKSIKSSVSVSDACINRENCLVPLEVVQVLNILNDCGFCQLLQASNTSSLMKFINYVKKEELKQLKIHFIPE